MFSLHRLAPALSILTAGFLSPLVRADNPINAGFPYGSEKVRGVNLGGWLVLEVCLASHCILLRVSTPI